MSERSRDRGPAGLDAAAPPFCADRPPGGFTWRRSGKRLFDILVSLALAPVAAPVVAAASAAILLTMGRPVFYRQARVGRGGRPFMILKLRTMRPPVAGGRIVTAQTATAKGDLRVTAVGRCLRRFHIDELPQLWNVVTGEMSVVGPRPEQPALAEAYGREAPAFAYRQLVRPGITGWAQVRAGYAADLAETRLKLGYDLFYVQNCSLSLDVEICARTVLTILSGAGAR